MKLTWMLFLAGTAVFAQQQFEFKTGQAARAVVGQRTFTDQDPRSSAKILGAAGGVAYVNGMLFVADASRFGAGPSNNRVLIFKDIQRQLPAFDAEIPFGFNEFERCPVCRGEATVVLGQDDFTKNDLRLTASGLRSPLAVHSDGVNVVVADTDNNRVLIWRSIPTRNGQPADVVIGQPNFTSNRPALGPSSMRGPQGVWIVQGRLYVADTQNHRVLGWNQIPTQNGQAADFVIGQPNFNTAPEIDLTRATVESRADNLLNPTTVSSDGAKLLVSDLGHNRVLIWNSLPNRNAAPADVVVGQKEFTTAIANNSPAVCAATGKDSEGKDTFPEFCGATLNFPRMALSDGRRLFISDGGNDRVLVYNAIPTQNGQSADAVLGQFSVDTNLTSDSAFPERVSSSDSFRTPVGLTFDGTNLYVADPFNRRVVLYAAAEQLILPTGVRNAASREIFAVGLLTFSGTIKENDEVTIHIGVENNGRRSYKYKILKDDTFDKVIDALVGLINAGAGDAEVLATPNRAFASIILTARGPGEQGNRVSIGQEVSANATIQVTTSGATLAGGQDAARIAPGTIVTLIGDGLADEAMSAEPNARDLPKELGGVQVYFDGIRAPLMMVSPTRINAQIPWDVYDSTSVTAWVRTKHRDGRVTVTTAVGVPVIAQNPGIFAEEDKPDPRPGIIYHSSSFATGTVSVDGTAAEGDKARIFINDRQYEYVVKKDDTLAMVRDGLVAAINDGEGDPQVIASSAGVFTRVRLRARVEGPAGNGIPIRGTAVDRNNAEAAQVIMTATNSALCCANRAGARITEANPAVPGETILLYATGLGIAVQSESEARLAPPTGAVFEPAPGEEVNKPLEFVSSLAGARTANVIFARLLPGAIGIYEVLLELNSDLPTNPQTQLTIAQSFQVSNIVTFPVQRLDN